ncbi:MAG TPA: PAS domain-containing protein, partial [Methylorubrum populi]|nr:PAS domain-containing protein [Methylorubrum populi]
MAKPLSRRHGDHCHAQSAPADDRSPSYREHRSMIWVTDHRGSLAYICREWHDLTGQGPSQALGTGWIEAVHPEDRAAVAGGFAEACRRQVEFMLRYRLRRANGTYVWVLDAASPSFTPLTHDFVGFLGLVSRYEDDVENLTAAVE